jgi:hypothetical protein
MADANDLTASNHYSAYRHLTCGSSCLRLYQGDAHPLRVRHGI